MLRIVSWQSPEDGRHYQAALKDGDYRFLILCHGATWSPADLDHYCRYHGMTDWWTLCPQEMQPHALSGTVN